MVRVFRNVSSHTTRRLRPQERALHLRKAQVFKASDTSVEHSGGLRVHPEDLALTCEYMSAFLGRGAPSATLRFS